MIIAIRGFILLLLLAAGQAAQAGADEQAVVQGNHIRVGMVQDTGSHADYCGTSLQFSKDFRKNYGKYAFQMTYAENDKAMMHLDGRDIVLQLTSRTQKENSRKRTVSEQLHFKSRDYRVDIKWLFTDICDKAHNEDCEIEGMRAYVTIYRNNHPNNTLSDHSESIRHIRLLGTTGC